MNIRKVFFLIIAIILLPLYGKSDIKIAILPYTNISKSSNYDYLSSYIPKMLVKNLDLDKEGYDVFFLYPNKESLNISDFSNTEDRVVNNQILDFLRKNGIRYGIYGSFLIEGKEIRIYTKVYDSISHKVIRLLPYVVLDFQDIFISTIERYCEEKAEFLKEKVLGIKSGGVKDFFQIEYWKDKFLQYGIKLILSNPFFAFFSILFSFILLAYLMDKVVINLILMKLASKTKTDIDDIVLQRIRKPLLYILILFGFRLGVVYLPFDEKTFMALKSVLNAIIIWQLSVLVWRVLKVFLRIWKDRAVSKGASSLDDLMPLIYDASKVFLFAVAFLLVISQFGIEIGPFIASLGIAGFAIGFAVKDVLGNIFGGVSLILDRTFRLGDKVEIEGYELGYVEEVGIRTTKIRTFNGELIVIPNGILVNKAFKNYGLPDASIRVCVNFSVAYGSDVSKVKEVVLLAIKDIPAALDEPPPVVEFLEMGDTSLNFVAKFWVSNFKEQYDNRLLAVEKIYNALNKAGIEIPFPTYTVYIRREDKEN